MYQIGEKQQRKKREVSIERRERNSYALIVKKESKVGTVENGKVFTALKKRQCKYNKGMKASDSKQK